MIWNRIPKATHVGINNLSLGVYDAIAYFNYGMKATLDVFKMLNIEPFRTECQNVVETAKLTYLKNLGNKVNDPSTSQKAYWKIINRVMNKCRAPKIPPLLVNNMFILNCREKAKLSNDHFSKQCRPITTSSVLLPLNPLTDKKNDHIPIQSDEILA